MSAILLEYIINHCEQVVLNHLESSDYIVMMQSIFMPQDVVMINLIGIGATELLNINNLLLNIMLSIC